mgnify:CR=1 FL=1
MNKGIWHESIIDEDSLGITLTDVEELENDELSIGEACFLKGYEEDASEYELYEE